MLIDLSKPLERGRASNLGGKSHWVIFKYEKMPLFYFHCGCIVHEKFSCPIRKSQRVNGDDGEKDWGIWLRAEIPRRERKGKGGTGG